MDNRRNVSEFLTFELVTKENLPQRFSEVEQALHLTPNQMRALYDGSNLKTFEQDLMESRTLAQNTIDDSIRKAITSREQDATLHEYFAHKDKVFADLRERHHQYLDSSLKNLIHDEIPAIEAAKQTLANLNSCYYGNHALKLTTLKKNIATALQNAACELAEYWADVKLDPDYFNAVFANIAELDENEILTIDSTTQSEYSSYDLKTLADKVSATLSLAAQHKNPMFFRIMQQQLNQLSDHRSASLKNKEHLFTLSNTTITFTDRAYAIEKLANDASQQAASALKTLDQHQETIISSYEHDLTKHEIQTSLRHAIQQSADGIAEFRSLTAEIRQIHSAVHQDLLELTNLLEQLQVITQPPTDVSRAESEHLLKPLNLTPALTGRVIQGLHEVEQNYRNDFLKKNRSAFQTQHYQAMTTMLTAMEITLQQLRIEAANQIPPLTAQAKILQNLKIQRMSYQQSLTDFYAYIEKLDQEKKNVAQNFEKARAAFIEFLQNTNQNPWRGDLLNRLDATLLDIDDLIKKYADHPEFHQTSLDDVVEDVLREAREQTLATKATVEPDFVPPALQPEPHRRVHFLDQHPRGRRVFYAVVCAIAAIIFTTAIIGTILATAGTGALAIGAIAGILVATGIASGSAGAAFGIFIDKHMEAHENTVTHHQRSRNASTYQALHGNNRQHKKEYSSDSEDDIEVIRDYARPRTFGDDSAEYARHRPRPF